MVFFVTCCQCADDQKVTPDCVVAQATILVISWVYGLNVHARTDLANTAMEAVISAGNGPQRRSLN